jgi:hypothetical protein
MNIDEKIKKFKEEFYNIGIGLFLWVRNLI